MRRISASQLILLYVMLYLMYVHTCLYVLHVGVGDIIDLLTQSCQICVQKVSTG
jgi:hypothetical protein